jgi:hypothetical protein
MKRTCMQTSIFAATLAIVFCLTAAAPAAPIVIDDFSTPNPAPFFLVGINHDNALPVEQAGLAEAVGGERDILAVVLGTPNPQSAQVLTGFEASLFVEGVFQVATAGNPATSVTLQYDGTDTDGATLVNARLLNLDLTGGGMNDELAIDFISVDAPGAPGLDLLISLSSPGGTATLADIVPESGSPFTHVTSFAAFAADPGFSFKNVDSIELVFNGPGVMDVDFAIGRIQAVPEPSTAALWVAGLAGILAVRRRRSGAAV